MKNIKVLFYLALIFACLNDLANSREIEDALYNIFDIMFASEVIENDQMLYSEKSSEDKIGSIIVLHGMGDSCKNLGMKNLIKTMSDFYHKKVVIKCIMIGKTLEEDTVNAFKLTMNDQASRVAELIQTDKSLKEPIYAIGFSQGNLVIRAYIQKYAWRSSYPSVKSFISIHGPLLGVGALPKCNPQWNYLGYFCDVLNHLTSELAYTKFIQNSLAQSNYYRDPYFIKDYLTTNFLPNLNFETISSTFQIRGIDSLDMLVLVKALNDHVVEPKDSEWFGMYEDNSFKNILQFNETIFYNKDLFGLKTLYNKNAIHFETTPDDHMQISSKSLLKLLKKYW